MSTPAVRSVPARNQVYSRVFWLSYLANVSLVMANGLTFRFADFVSHLGGTIEHTGDIVSMGVVAALVARLVLGQAIDRYGTRRLWMASSVLFILGGILFLCAQSVAWPIFAARVFFTVGLAGMFTCSMVHIQNQVPAHRRTEVIASLGSSGFVGMIVGTRAGDWIFRHTADVDARYWILFGAVTALGGLYLFIVWVVTRADVHKRPERTPAAHELIFRHWPGSIVFPAMMMGVAFTVYSVFLTRFVADLSGKGYAVAGIGTFFTAYAISAFTFRLLTRNWSRFLGRHRMVLIGLVGHAAACFVIPHVTADWQFIGPAVLGGVGHALLFPGVVSLGAGTFPQEYRGSGTTLVLGFTEVGAALGGWGLSRVVEQFDFVTMFHVAAWTSLAIGAVYAFTGARLPDEDLLGEDVPTAPQPEVVPAPRVAACEGVSAGEAPATATELCGTKQ
ncbi:MAG: MFS transporter [Planctomycetaceae bacterium]